MSKLIDMSGQRIGKLLVLSYAGSKFRGRAARASFFCRCDCGREIIVTGAKLREREKAARGPVVRGKRSDGAEAGAPGGHQAAVVKSRACPANEVSG